MPRRSRDTNTMRRRRQPTRRCKRIRLDNKKHLLELPIEMIREIIEFSQPQAEQGRWLWYAQVSGVCHVFRELANILAPTTLDVLKAFEVLPSKLRLPFIRIFLECPSMAARVTSYEVTDFDIDDAQKEDVHSSLQMSEIFDAVQSLCTTPGALPNCKELYMWISMADEPSGIVNSNLLQNLYKGLPKLTKLNLLWDDDDVWNDHDAGLTPQQFGMLAQSLQMPLQHLDLVGFRWLEDDHVAEFVRRQRDLEFLSIANDEQITDKTLRAIAWNCPEMSSLSLEHTSITAGGIQSYIRNNGDELLTLEIDHCPLVGAELVDYLVELGPIFATLSLEGYTWLTDELLDRLVQGQMEYWEDELTLNGPWEEIDVKETSVTEAGARRVVAKPRIGQLTITGDGWTVSNRTEEANEED